MAIIYKYSGGTRTKTVSGQNAPSEKTTTTTKDISTRPKEEEESKKVTITKSATKSQPTVAPKTQEVPKESQTGLKESSIKYNPKTQTITSRASGEVLFSNVSAVVTKGGDITQIQQTKDYAGPRGKERITFTPEGEVLSEEKKGVYASHKTNKIFIDGKEANLLKSADYTRVKEAGIKVSVPEETKPYTEWYAAEVERDARMRGALPFASQLESEYGDYLTATKAPGGGYQVSVLEGVSDEFGIVLGRAVDYYSGIFSYSDLEATEGGYLFTDKPLDEKEYLMSKEFGGDYVSSIGTTEGSEIEIGFSSGDKKAFAALTESQKEAFLTAYAPELESLRQDVGTGILNARATETGKGESFETGVELVREGDKLFYDYDKGLLTFESKEHELSFQPQETSAQYQEPVQTGTTELQNLESRISEWDSQLDDVIEDGWGEGWEDRQVVSKDNLKTALGYAPGVGTTTAMLVDYVPDKAFETMEYAVKTNIDFAARGGIRAVEMGLTAGQGAKELSFDKQDAIATLGTSSESWEKFKAPFDLTRKYPVETLLVAGSVLLPVAGSAIGGAVAGEGAIIGESLLSTSAARAVGGQAISAIGRGAIPVGLAGGLAIQEMERGYSIPEAIARGGATILLAEGAMALATKGLPKVKETPIEAPKIGPETLEKPTNLIEPGQFTEATKLTQQEGQTIWNVGKKGKTTEVLAETGNWEVAARESLFKELQSAVELKPETAKESVSSLPKEFLEVPKESIKLTQQEARSILDIYTERPQKTYTSPETFSVSQQEARTILDIYTERPQKTYTSPETFSVSQKEARSILEIYRDRPTEVLTESTGLRPPDIPQLFKETIRPEEGFSRFEEVPTILDASKFVELKKPTTAKAAEGFSRLEELPVSRESYGQPKADAFLKLKEPVKPKEPEGFSRFEEVPTILDASEFVELRKTTKPPKGTTKETGAGTVQLELTKTKEVPLTKETAKTDIYDFLELRETTQKPRGQSAVELITEFEPKSKSGTEFIKDLNEGKIKIKTEEKDFFGRAYPQPTKDSAITEDLLDQFEKFKPKITTKTRTKTLTPPFERVDTKPISDTTIVPKTFTPTAQKQATAVNPIQRTAVVPAQALASVPVQKPISLQLPRAKPKEKTRKRTPEINYLFLEGAGPTKKKKKKKKKEKTKLKKFKGGEGVYSDLLSVAKTELKVGVGKARHPRLSKRPQLRSALLTRRIPTSQMLEGKIKKSETFKLPKGIKSFGKKKQTKRRKK